MRTRAWLSIATIAVALLLAGCAAPETTNTPEPTGTRTATSSPTTSTTSPSVSGTPQASAPVTSFPPASPWPRLSFVPRWSGLSQPIFLTFQPSDPSHILIAEKGGRIRSVRGGAVETAPFLDLSASVSSGGEQGLLSLAFPPGKASAKRVYACYTARNGDVVVSRFAMRPDGSADRASEREVLRVPHSRFPNHNGGEILFGPDGYLYVGVGDGGSEGDPNGNGQDRATLLAKLLRIDVEGVDAGGRLPATYTVPKMNPFVGVAGVRPEIWAYGLRNPWRFSFDAATRDLYIGDVGQDAWEEIDFQPGGSRGGQDYGWSLMEGDHPFKGGPRPGLTPPVTEYGHDLGDAVVGGYVYRGRTQRALQGVYLFGDDGSGRVWGLRRAGGAWQMRELGHPGYTISSFGEDSAGELYVLDLAGGVVYQVTAR